MKKIFAILLSLVLYLSAAAQKPVENYTWYDFKGFNRFSGPLRIPRDTLPGADTGLVAFLNNTLYLKDNSGHYVRMAKFSEIAGGGGGSMDSSIFATIHRVDSLNALYARAATTLTINGVAQTIAANRTWSVGTLVGTDTVSLSNRINTKLNITDTTGKWVSTTYKKTGTDSIFQNKGGTITFLYRVDSVSGGGGGSPNTSVGSGYKVAINGTNNIKSITASQHIGLDSLTSNQLNIFADTTKLATKLALVKARDSVQTNVNLKADKSTTISAGTGIGSGLGDISANRTVNVDTSVMLTKLAAVKLRDSVQTNVNTKANSSLTLSAGVGIDATGLGALTANRTISIDTSKMETKLAMKKTTDSLAALITSTVTVSSATSLTLAGSNTYVFSGSSNTTWTLPAIGTTGRTYRIKNRGSAYITLQRAGSDQLYDAAAIATIVILPGDALEVQDDGTYWIIM